MGELVEVYNHEVIRNPNVLSNVIAYLADEIETNQNRLEGIKSRNFFQRIGNNNTKDLANAIMSQNDTISKFMTIIQGVIFLNLNNTVVLSQIWDELEDIGVKRGMEHNEYMGIAKEVIKESIVSANKTKDLIENQKREIKNLKSQISKYQGKLKSQEKIINNMDKELENIRVINSKQEEIIFQMGRKIESIIKENANNKNIIDTIDEQLAKIHNNQEDQIKAITNNREEISSNRQKVNHIIEVTEANKSNNLKQKKINIYLLAISAVSLIISIINLILN